MSLKRDDACSACSTILPAETKAEWDKARRVVTCLPCVGLRTASTATTGSSEQLVTPPPAITNSASESQSATRDKPITVADFELDNLDHGVAGTSARREHERRKARQNKKIEAKYGTGFVGKVAKVFSNEPQSTKAWEKGAAGEERVAQILTKQLGDRAVLLHDRSVPKTRGNIDHIVIASSGVWIVDAKKYTGKVERRDKGSMFKSDYRLYVNGRDRSKQVESMGWQHNAVSAALVDTVDVPIHCALTFVNAEWPILFRKPLLFGDVHVSWPTKLADLIAQPGSMTDDDVHAIARVVAKQLPSVR